MIIRRQAIALGCAALFTIAAPHSLAQARRVYYPEDFGAEGDGRADDADAINACDLAAARLGATVILSNTYRVGSQLQMSAPWHFEGGVILRDWTGAHHTGQKDASATIKGRGNDPLAAFYLDPGPYRPRGVLNGLSLTGEGSIRMTRMARAFYDAQERYHATMLYMLCDNFHLAGVTFELGGNDWCICYGGDQFLGEPFRIEASPTTTGPHIYEDGFHVLFGRSGRGHDWNIESGDDSIAFANTLNLRIADWLVTNPRVFSSHAFGIKIASQRFGATAKFGRITQPLQNIHIVDPRWAEPKGRRSRNGYVRFDAIGNTPGIIRNCSVTGGVFDGENNGLPPRASTGVAAVSFDGPVEDCTIHARIRHPSLWATLATPGAGGAGPVRSSFNVDSPDLPNWAKGVRTR